MSGYEILGLLIGGLVGGVGFQCLLDRWATWRCHRRMRRMFTTPAVRIDKLWTD